MAIENLIIIGSGPAGYTAGIYAGRANLSPICIEGYQSGGLLMLTSDVENFPGFPEGMMGPDLMAKFRKQAEKFGTRFISKNATRVDFSSFPLKVYIEDEEIQTKAVIISTGAATKWIGLESESRLLGKGVSSCATCDGAFFKGAKLVIVGGGDSAMEEADFLTKFADKVYLLHRSQKFRASVVMLERAKKNPKIQIVTDVQITELIGEKNLEKVILNKTNNEPNLVINEEITKNNIWKILENWQIEMKLDGLFVAIGHDPNTGFVANLLDKNEAGYLIPQSRLPREERTSKYNMATKIPGVFLAGDVEDYEYRQAITAAGSGCMAAIDCERWLEAQH